ncbi:hypothetical protein FQN49_008438, partial [Arthroderma sp. PD_2]
MIGRAFKGKVDVDVSPGIIPRAFEPERATNSSSIRHSHARSSHARHSHIPGSIVHRANQHIVWRHEEDEDKDLSYLSQPNDLPIDDTPDYYYYDESDGGGTVVYVIDSGAELGHDSFSHVQNKRWIWSMPNPDTHEEDFDTIGQHGTKVLSRIVGDPTGTAGKAAIVIVVYTDKNGKNSYENTIDALWRTYDDIRARPVTDKVVINMSWGVPISQHSGINMAYVDIFNKISDLKNVVMVSAAGNGPP